MTTQNTNTMNPELTELQSVPVLQRSMSSDHLPVATEVVMAESISHNKYLGNLYKKIFSYKYKMDMETFVKAIRTGPRKVAKNSVITYTRNLKRLAADMDAIGDVEKDWDNDNSFTENLEADVAGTSVQMGLQLLADNAAMLLAMSSSVRKARIAALLVGIDPEKSDAAINKWSTKSYTFKQRPDLFTHPNYELEEGYAGRFPKNGDYQTYFDYVNELEDDADNIYKDEVTLNTKKKIRQFLIRDKNHDGGVNYSQEYRGHPETNHRSLAYITPVHFWTGEYYEKEKTYDEPVLAGLINDLRAHAVKEQRAYSQSTKIKSVKEDKNWVTQKQIEEKAVELRNTLNEIFRKKDVDIPNNSKLVKWAKARGEAQKAAFSAANTGFKAWIKEDQATRGESPMAAYWEIYGKKDTKTSAKEYTKKYWEEALPASLTNKPFMSALINAFVASIYTELPPRRLDWAKLHFISKPNWDKMDAAMTAQDGGYHDAIYYVYPKTKYGINPGGAKSFIVFGARAGKSPQQEDLRVDDVGPNIRKLGTMIFWISKLRGVVAGAQGRPVIITNPGFKEIEENALGKRVKKIFSGKYGGVKKSITASLLRKIFITTEFKGDTEKKMRIAALMNHSVKIQQAIYYKQEEKEWGDKIMTGDDLNEVESNQIPVDYWTKKHLHKPVVE